MATQDQVGQLPEVATMNTNANGPSEPTQTEVVEPTSQEKSASNEPASQPNPRLHALSTKKAALESTLSTLQAQKATLVASSTLPSGLSMPDSWSEEEKSKSALATANSTIKEHISLLHKYNEIKDIAQGLMGLIAETRGVRVKVVMEEMGVGDED